MKETLHCEAGHKWTRDVVRGRKPQWCPDHRPAPPKPAERRTEAPRPIVVDTVPAPKPQTAKPVPSVTNERARWIKTVLDNAIDCHCPIDPQMTDDELMTVQSCTPGWVCSTLDYIRRSKVNYKRHSLITI